MMRPPRRVIVGPQAGVDLRNNNLLVFRAQVVDLFAKQCGGIDAMCPNLNFLVAVARNHLVTVDRVLQIG